MSSGATGSAPTFPTPTASHGAYRTLMRYDVLDRAGEQLAGPFAYFLGQGGQAVYLRPQDDLVVVRFGDGFQLVAFDAV